MSPTPASLVVDAFSFAFPTEAARKQLGDRLIAEHANTVMVELGRSLVCNGPVMPLLLVDNALMSTRWDDDAPGLAARLAVSAEPWRTLGAAITQTIADRDHPPDNDLEIWSDEELAAAIAADVAAGLVNPDDPVDWLW